MDTESTVKMLKEYLDYAGILACNENPYLPSLSDIGCGWSDVMALVDSHELFYSKAYRGRTTYLSLKSYYLLKRIRKQRAMDENAARIHELLKSEPLDMEMLRLLSCMEREQLDKALQFLLRNLYATALRTGNVLNPNWSTFYYCTAEAWEAHVKKPDIQSDPGETLRSIFSRTMAEKEIDRLLR